MLHGIQVPLGIPVLVNGWMNGGWRVSAFQLVMIGASFMIYYPFFKKADAEALEQEQQAEAKAAATAATN